MPQSIEIRGNYELGTPDFLGVQPLMVETQSGTLGARVGRVLERSKMGKCVRWDVIDGRLSWSFDVDKIVAEKLFRGLLHRQWGGAKEKMAASEVKMFVRTHIGAIREYVRGSPSEAQESAGETFSV